MNFKIINLEAINQSMMGNSALIKELVDLYIMQSPIDFQALENAISVGEYPLIREKAHHIKPTMQYIGAGELLQEFQQLENLAKEKTDLSTIKNKFQEIEPKFSLMIEELNQLASSFS